MSLLILAVFIQVDLAIFRDLLEPASRELCVFVERWMAVGWGAVLINYLVSLLG